MQNSFFSDPEFWKGIAFILSFFAVCFPVYRFCLKKMQQENQKVFLQIKEALSLYHQAKKSFMDSKNKYENISIAKQRITKTAENTTQALKTQFENEFDAKMLSREKENEERICIIRENGIKKIQDKVWDIAVQTTENVLTDESFFANKQMFTKKSLEELKNILKDEKNVSFLKDVLMEEG